MKRLAISVAAALVLGSSPFAISSAFAYDPASTAAINVDKAGVGLRGYDPISYFVAGTPQMGTKQFSAAHKGVTYHFTSEDNRKKFAVMPDAFAPQFGGFCQTGVALLKKLDGDPTVWRVADGKLFVYVNEGAKAKFLENIPAHTVAADSNWPRIMDKAPKDL